MGANQRSNQLHLLLNRHTLLRSSSTTSSTTAGKMAGNGQEWASGDIFSIQAEQLHPPTSWPQEEEGGGGEGGGREDESAHHVNKSVATHNIAYS